MPFGFRSIDVDGERRFQCLLCMKILAVDSIKPHKLKSCLETVDAECVGKHKNFFIEN
jgi:hypothetical protein